MTHAWPLHDSCRGHPWPCMPQSSRNTLVYFGGPRALQAYSTMPSEAVLGVWLVIFGCFSEWSPRRSAR